MIEARDIGYRVGETWLVRGVSLKVEPGEILALVGPNGAGKSTLLRTLAGELAPTNGQVLLNGKPLAAMPLAEQAKVRAVLAQSSELTFPFAAAEVVLMGRAPHVKTRETLHDHAIAAVAMHATDSRTHAERLYPTLSGGEKQRVHAARAAAQIWEGPAPRALLLDEPTSSLDLAHQHAILELAKRMAREGCAVVCALHDLNLAAQYADRLLVLANGEVRAVASPSVVLTRELLADVFRVRAHVLPHPELACPLVVPTGAAFPMEESHAP
ncbi:MAG TPA: heme ABC transporter ATP-binding protein [Polyangiaceae bacterium]